MEFNNLAIILLTTSVLFFAFTLYLTYLYRFKKKESESLVEKLARLKKEQASKSELLAATELELVKINSAYKEKHQSLQDLLNLEKREEELKTNVNRYLSEILRLQEESQLLLGTKDNLKKTVNALKSDISLYSPVHDLTEVGFFEEPKYLFETSERFKEEIKIIREKQKQMIKEKTAILIPESIPYLDEFQSSKTKKILDGQSKILLKAFNIECDILMDALKPSNFAKTLERIEKLAATLEKSAASLHCGFSTDFVKLKYSECEHQYQFKLKQEFEKEEQRIIKEQMREEQRAIREFEKALAKAQKEEAMYQDALQEARKQLEVSSEDEKEKLQAKIDLLQKKLTEAEASEKRAKSMAEQTKRGHVYVISNLGSFGKNIYKIGLTRRLEPLDRVKELGDASVPFSFDVHAMIFSKNAPALESQLHRVFDHQRVNAVNRRKEFFNVSLNEIKTKAIEVIGEETDFKMTMLAEEYHESMKLRGTKVLEDSDGPTLT